MAVERGPCVCVGLPPMTVHSGPATVAVAAANFCAALLLGPSQESFDFCGGPHRPFCSGACGALALADLLSHLLGDECSLVPSPVLFGGMLTQASSSSAVPALLEHGLADLLKVKGACSAGHPAPGPWTHPEGSSIAAPVEGAKGYMQQCCPPVPTCPSFGTQWTRPRVVRL